ncbi:MAG TPA: nucleotidyl transferase AbiEii/AbiGii toxin family protein [Chthoniobacterales bacterium]|nr:nucleotidyl transferase AbiEii/AbiGii toxin family protein [Chthoniobacterales bacterium]
MSDIQSVERFHLLFLDQLGKRLDKKLYALKGGCNLRFFWKSIRYSEDIDFDVHTIAKHTLQKNVNQILESVGFEQILRSHKTQLTKVSQPKQTDTTQRWKLHLLSETSGTDLPTRIEFSRRKFDPGIIFGPADPQILTQYSLRPIIASHYNLETAFAQKIQALIYRKETQARDIFDLAFVSERGAKGSAIKLDKETLAKACEIVLSVSFDQFRSQVVAYLPPEYQKYYGPREAWDTMQGNVVRLLETL